MEMRIRVTTRANLFEKRKQQHIERGYRVEDGKDYEEGLRFTFGI